MADADGAQTAGQPGMLPGFRLEPAVGGGAPCWFRGRPEGGGPAVLMRRIGGISFAIAIADLASVADLFDSCPAGMAAPVAIAVTHGQRIVAGSAAAMSDIDIVVDPAAGLDVASDAVVDVWAAYLDEGVEVLNDVATAPLPAVERLAVVAPMLDELPAGHGAIEAPALRLGPAGPHVLGFGLASLETARRGRLDDRGSWLTVAPERCLPPGVATSQSDQYALAALWTMARTGKPPHDGDTAEAVVRSKLSEPPRLDSLEPGEQAVVARALASSAEDRFESSTAFIAALREALVAGAAPGAAVPSGGNAPEPMEARPAPSAEGDMPFDTPARESTVPAAGDRTADGVTACVDPAGVDPAGVDPAGGDPAGGDPAGGDPAGGDAAQPVRVEPIPVPQVAVVSDASGAGVGPPLATAPYKAGDLILPGYRLERPLGKGGFGEVWKATAPGGMSVAIKIIGNLGRREGAREFRALGTVRNVHHAHIVPMFGVWLKTSDGRVLNEEEATRAGREILHGREHGYRNTIGPESTAALDSLELVVAMGLGDRTLYDALRMRDPDTAPGIEQGQLLGWMRQAALAIDHFNRGSVRDGMATEAVQHCDIKPQNMLLVGNVVQVCDFGLARAQGQARATANNILSIAYAAPEMMVRPFNPSPNTDQYSLAVSYYELRTGRLPYGEQPESSSEEVSAVELMRAKSDGKVTLDLVPPTEQRVLRRALALDPADRFGSCEELVDMLESAVEMDRTRQPSPPSFPWLRAGGLAIGGVLATALVAWILLPRELQTPPPPPRLLLPEARAALNDAVTGEGIAQSRVQKAADLSHEARSSGEDADACNAVEAAATAVLRAIPLIAAIRDEGDEIAGLSEAHAAVHELPASVPESLRVILKGDLEKRTSAAQAAQAERVIMAVLSDAAAEPAGLDAAVASFHRASASMPATSREPLQRRLAGKLVDRAVARLKDNDLQTPAMPVAGRTRALEDSVKDLDSAISLDPRSWRAHDRRGFCETLRGRHEEAIEAYGRALEVLDAGGDATAGDQDDVLRGRSYALSRLRRYQEAADDLWRIASVDDEMAKERAWLLACGFGPDPETRAVPVAKELLSRAADIHERANLLDTLACAYARAGDFEKALETIDEALRAEPGDVDFLEHRGRFEQHQPWDRP